jgi:L-ascorbate metabolism protein UlaG (beta-lactamase superfamily)
MKIKRIGWTSFLLSSSKISLITDPLLLNASGVSFPKTSADIALFTNVKKDPKKSIILDNELEKKLVPDSRDTIMEIYMPGEFEVGGMMIRRDVGTSFYMIDQKTVRVVYLGGIDESFDVEKVKDLGDVDVLIAPVGNSDSFLSFEKLEKVFSYIDPEILLPCAYAEDGSKEHANLKSKEEFIKHFGFTNVHDESYITVKPSPKEEDQKSMEVIFL